MLIYNMYSTADLWEHTGKLIKYSIHLRFLQLEFIGVPSNDMILMDVE